MSTKLLTEQMFTDLYKPMVNSLNGAPGMLSREPSNPPLYPCMLKCEAVMTHSSWVRTADSDRHVAGGGRAGETTENLLWRITQLEGFNHTAPWVCVLNIGQADLEGGMTVRLSMSRSAMTIFSGGVSCLCAWLCDGAPRGGRLLQDVRPTRRPPAFARCCARCSPCGSTRSLC